MNPSNPIHAVRKFLNLSQKAFGEVIDCSQGNVVYYEKGQPLPVDRAERLIDYAQKQLGVSLTLDQVYGRVALPEALPAKA